MSEKNTLKIFKSLKPYFAILCANNCNNYNEVTCKELIDILSSKNCDSKEGLDDSFLSALSNFAYELSKADTPVGKVTIKNKLEKIFLETEFNDNYVESVLKAVVNATDLSGFKMLDNIGEGEKTYREVLEEIYTNSKCEKVSDKCREKIFNEWIKSAFEIYGENEKYFDKEVKPYLTDLDDCELKLLNNFFEIAVDSEKVYVRNYIKKMNDDYKDKKARLNVKINTESQLPELLSLLPESVKDQFEKYLITPKKKVHFIYDEPECYKLRKTEVFEVKKKENKLETVNNPPHYKPNADSGETEVYKVPNPVDVLKWFEREALDVRKKRTEPEIVDKFPDAKPYVDSDNTNYKYPDSFPSIVNFQDNWRADLLGRLWKKNSSTGKFEEYTEENLIADSSLFKKKEGYCGNLCIFSDPDKCSKFFEKMMHGDPLSMDELSSEINSGDFVSSYKQLKDNLAKVNPLFVIGTLRMFGFEKYNELKEDGTNIVKIESFTRWWSRYGKKLDLTPNNPFPGTHVGLNPEPPANLELFFKLLILFINNNEFVLNPQSKQLINKSGKPKVSEWGRPSQFIVINGKKVPYQKYDQALAIFEGKSYPTSSEPESLSSLVELMRKNATLSSRPINMSLPENRANLSTLLDLMIGVTTGGKIRLSKNIYSTGTGYLVGGAERMLPCTTNANEIYTMGIEALSKKNKSLNSKDNEELLNQIKQLENLEQDVYDKLYVLAQFVKVINLMNDEASDNNLTMHMMDKVIKEYEDKSSKLSSKTDSIISMLLKNLFDLNNHSTSYYSKL
jgi:hypothetical protein